MTREQAKQYLPIIEAWAEGKPIQCHHKDFGWGDFNGDSIDFDRTCLSPAEMRIKPREFWLGVSESCGNINIGAVYLTRENALKDSFHQTIIHVKEVTRET